MNPSGGSERHVDVLVIGSGIAGLTAALDVARLAPGARVLVATKAALGDGATAWAQGGVAAVVADPADPGGPADPARAADTTGSADSVALHVADTLAAGDGLCVPEAVEVLCAEGAGAIAALVGRGLVLDREPGGSAPAPRLARGLEAAHSRRRVLHAGGDVTGAHVTAALVAAVCASAVEVVEDAVLVDLVADGGRVVGADLLLDPPPSRIAPFPANRTRIVVGKRLPTTIRGRLAPRG